MIGVCVVCCDVFFEMVLYVCVSDQRDVSYTQYNTIKCCSYPFLFLWIGGVINFCICVVYEVLFVVVLVFSVICFVYRELFCMSILKILFQR